MFRNISGFDLQKLRCHSVTWHVQGIKSSSFFPRHPNTQWGSVFEPPFTSPEVRLLRVPNTDPHQVWLEDFGRLGFLLENSTQSVGINPPTMPTPTLVEVAEALGDQEGGAKIDRFLTDVPRLTTGLGKSKNSVSANDSPWNFFWGMITYLI